jgi:anaerobic ribonucleoside-triphosphate reductase activating protein
MKLRVAQTVAQTYAEGPGLRFALWVQGCSLRCAGCCNPEMFSAEKGGTLTDVATLAKQIAATPNIEGVSFLGGEPFEQAAPLAVLAQVAQQAGLTVMVYSGFTLAELRQKTERRVSGVAELMAATDLLVDGRFEQSLPEKNRRWVGSQNQVLHFLSARYQQDDVRFLEGNTIELRYQQGQLTVNGWPAAADAVWSRR